MKTLITTIFFFTIACLSAKGQSFSGITPDLLFKEVKEKCLSIRSNLIKPQSSMSYVITKTRPFDSTLLNISKTTSTITKRNLMQVVAFIDSLMDLDTEELVSSTSALDLFLNVNQYHCDYYFQANKIALIVEGEDRHLILKFGPSE